MSAADDGAGGCVAAPSVVFVGFAVAVAVAVERVTAYEAGTAAGTAESVAVAVPAENSVAMIASVVVPVSGDFALVENFLLKYFELICFEPKDLDPVEMRGGNVKVRMIVFQK